MLGPAHGRRAPIDGDTCGPWSLKINSIAESEEHQRLTGASFWIEILRAKPGPRLRSTPQSAIDTLWLYMAPDHYTRLVTHRHWTQQKYRHWLTRLITDLFEPSDDTTHDGR